LEPYAAFNVLLGTFSFIAHFFLKDDVLLFDYNVQERVNDFVSAALEQVTYRDHLYPLFTVILHG